MEKLTTQYLMLVCIVPPFDPGDPAALERETEAWVDEMDGNGTRQTGSRLRPYAEAATVRVRSDSPSIGAGLFGEMKDRIAGFDIIECADLDSAIAIAAKHPMAKLGAIEIRELC